MFDPYELTGLFWDGMSYALGSFLEEVGGGARGSKRSLLYHRKTKRINYGLL